jgi:membrane protease YdiL (CAAX protease family)
MNDSRLTWVAAAWALMLLVSDLPDILCKAFFGPIPAWLSWAKVGALVVGLALCLLWEKLRPLRQYTVVLLVLFLALGVTRLVGKSPFWQGRFGGARVSFARGYIGIYLLDSAVALAVIAALWIMKRRREAFFLVKGRLAAPIEPVPWLGIRSGESWRAFGPIFTIAAALAVMVPTMLLASFPLSALGRALPLLPFVLLFAAVNAFNEEIYFRASLLSTLHEVIGKNQVLLLSSVFFGLAHYLYGSPPGVVGFLMTGFLAWLLGKSMLETRGLFWPWFIHFVSDIVVFQSYALSRV